MPKGVLGRLEREGAEKIVVRDAPKHNGNLNVRQQAQLTGKMQAAGGEFHWQGFVARRSAVGGSGDVGVTKSEPVVAGDAFRLRGKACLVESAVKEVARGVAGEHAPGAVCSMSAGGEPNDEKARGWVTKGRHRFAPVRPVEIGAAFVLGNAGTVLAKARAAATTHNLAHQALQGSHKNPDSMFRMERRNFLAATVAAPLSAATTNGRLAILGGEPVRRGNFPSWPKFDQLEEQALLGVLRSARWGRHGSGHVEAFERKYAELTGARHVLATANGTSALFTSLNALGVGPGDEVIVPPYTFVATVNVVLLQHALPVFVDTDQDSFQIDARKISAQITDRTAAIVPVHMAGGAADLDTVLETAKARNIPVLEDACQAHLGEWKGRKLGTYGAAGCFSFQASKNLNSGEGGAVITNDSKLFERCYSFHTNGRPWNGNGSGLNYVSGGANLRLTEFQAALLESQMTRVEAQSRVREENARYLTSMLEKIPGIHPVRNYAGCTRSAWHLYMLRYDKEAFAGVSRATFLKALAAEGIRGSSGYQPLNKEPFIKETILSKGYRKIYPEKLLTEWHERNQCPVNDQLCEQAVWFTQTMLLGPRSDMEQIAAAVAKIQAQAAELRKL